MQGTGAAHLDLPTSMRINPVINVSQLKPYNGDADSRPPPVFLDDAAEPAYIVEKILARKRVRQGYQYLVKWAGYPEDEATWEPRSSLKQLTAFQDFTTVQPEDGTAT